MSGAEGKRWGRGGVWVGCGAVLLALLAGGSCKREPAAPPTVHRPSQVTGPSSEELAVEARAKLMEGLNVIPALDFGKPFVATDGEVWVKYENGMMIHVLRPGEGGLKPRLGQTVTVTYRGFIPGTAEPFDRHGADDALVFKLGSKDLLKGFNVGVSTMNLHEKTRFFVPADLAYGKEGKLLEGIGKDQDLIFEVELLSFSGDPVGFTLEDLPKVEPMGPPAPSGAGAGTQGAGTAGKP